MFRAAPGLSEQVADHLEKMIITEELKPKERIPEVRISELLKVSRGTVREALLILERRHLIVLIPRRGALVAELTPADINGLYDMLVCLYSLLLEGLAQKWTHEDELDSFEKLLQQMKTKALKEETLAVFQLTFQLIELACRLLNNLFLTESLHNLKPVFSRVFYRGLASQKNELQKILELIEQILEKLRKREIFGLKKLIQVYGEYQRKLAISFHSLQS
ncbi:MAG: GntR family transcriptional regulator [Planctomycetota bacterium]